MRQKALSAAGGFLSVAILLAGSVVSIAAFINPYPISVSRFDPVWASIFLIFVALSALLWMPVVGGRLKWLFLIGVPGFFLVTFALSPARWAILGVILFSILFVSLGLPVFQLLLPNSKTSWSVSHLIFAWGIGFEIVALLVFFLGLAGGLKPWILRGGTILLFLVFTPVSLYKMWKNFTALGNAVQPFHWNDRRNAMILGGVLTLGAGSLLWALTPTIRYDALVYHLAAPEAYLQYSKIIPQPMNFQTFQAHASQMVNTLALALFGQPLPSLLHLLAGFFTVVMIYGVARKLGGVRLGILAAVLFGSLPLIDFEAGTAYNDLFVTLFTVCCFYAFLEWEQSRLPNWLWIGGIMAGVALGIKFNVITLLIPLSLVLVIRLIQKYGLTWRMVSGAIGWGLPIIMLYAPWAVRDYLWTGNPLFPLLDKIFPSPITPVWSMVRDNFQFYPQNMLERILRLPWDLTFNTAWYYHEGLNGALGAVPLLALPWLYLTVPREERKRNGLLLLITASAAVLYMFLSTRIRTMMHLFPFMSILAALNLEYLWRALRQNRYAKAINWGAGIVVCLYLFSTRLNLVVRGWEIPERFPYRAALGFQAPQDYLAQNLKVYDAFQMLDQQPGVHKVLALGTKFNLYTRSEIWGDPISGGDALIGYKENVPPGNLAKLLAEHAFDYLLVDWDAVKAEQLENLPVLNPKFLSTYARLGFAWNNISVYALSPVPVVPGASGPNNLLQDASFETLPAPGKPFAWAVTTDQVENIWTKAYAHSGTYAVVPDPSVPMFQEIPVESGQIYTLSHWTRADLPGETARLQINWADQQHVFISASIQVVDVSNAWAENQLSVTPPPNTAFAQIFVEAHEGSQIFFDDFCFASGDVCVP